MDPVEPTREIGLGPCVFQFQGFLGRVALPGQAGGTVLLLAPLEAPLEAAQRAPMRGADWTSLLEWPTQEAPV